ncbi:MAG: PilW family protein [Ilumatobacteraceae bacterium]|jgi:type IV pilus assembly protein PilW|nr:PilW family protein [Ilumatobacteraceae bacterium]
MKYLQPCQFSAGQTRCIAKKLSCQHGLTLIELMVSIVLGLFLVGGVLSIFVSSNQTYKLNDNLMRVQENARSAFDLMARDIREAGQNPCGARKNIVNVLRTATGAIPVWTDWNLGTLRGYDDTQAATDIKAFGTAVAARVSGTDAVLVIKADANEKAMECQMEKSTILPATCPTSSPPIDLSDPPVILKLTQSSAFKENDIAFICDALSSAIFQVYSIYPISGSGKGLFIDHRADSTNMNCGDFLWPNSSPTTCPNPPTVADTKRFVVALTSTPEVRIAPLASSFWYVGNSGSGKRSLYRSIIKRSGTTVIMSADEVIPDVQDLQVTYLTRDGNTGTLADNWVAASAITDWAADSTAIDTPAIQRVVAVKLDLTLQTVDKVSTSQAVIQRHLLHVIRLRNREEFVAP